MTTEQLGAPTAPRTVRAVVFDLDGVLVDSFQVMRKAFTIAYAEVVGEGTPPFEEYNRHLGRYFPDIMRIMGLPMEMETPFVRESYRLAREVTVFEGVEPTLRELRSQGIRTAVATGKTGARARALLAELGILNLFDHVIGSDEVRKPKPAPDIVRKAIKLLKIPAEEAMMIGDAVTDLTSAKGAGVTAAAALWADIDEEKLLAAAPDVVLRTPTDIMRCIATVPIG
jgi:AHBA synthesis associated protein